MKEQQEKKEPEHLKRNRLMREAILTEMSLYFSRNPEAKKEITERAQERLKRENA